MPSMKGVPNLARASANLARKRAFSKNAHESDDNEAAADAGTSAAGIHPFKFFMDKARSDFSWEKWTPEAWKKWVYDDPRDVALHHLMELQIENYLDRESHEEGWQGKWRRRAGREYGRWRFKGAEDALAMTWIEFKNQLGIALRYAAYAGIAGNLVDDKLGENNIRNVQEFFSHDGILNAVNAFKDVQSVMVLTGFSVAQGMPETDGPPGAVAIAYAHYQAGHQVTMVADAANMPIVKACAAALDPGFARYVRYEQADFPHESDGDRQACELLDRVQPDAVISIELPGANREGGMSNMRGVSVKEFNAALYKIVEQANARGLPTAGIGDGGNETGVLSQETMAREGTRRIPKAMDGSEMASAVPSRHAITAWNSNLGGYAYSSMLLKQKGLSDQMISGAQVETISQAALDAGAVDGVTRKTEAGAPSDSDSRFVTGVDGYPLARHKQDVDELNASIRGMTIPERSFWTIKYDEPMLYKLYNEIDKYNALLTNGRKYITKRLLKAGIELAYRHATAKEKAAPQRPVITVAMGDSSHGGLVGGKNVLVEGMKKAYPEFEFKFIFVLDHDKAPYGQYSPQEIDRLDNNMLHTAQNVGADIFLMVCNTASTRLDSPAATEGINIPVVNLVYETSKGMVQAGGAHPAIVSTQATADSPSYKDTVSKVSGGKLDIRPQDRIGAPTWAPAINNVEHLTPGMEEAVQKKVDDVINRVPDDATSVWTCCTHYPEFIPQIRETLKKRGMEHVRVIDPMEYMLQGAVGKIAQMPKVKAARQQDLSRAAAPRVNPVTVVSSGSHEQVTESAVTLLGGKLGENKLQFATGVDFGREPSPLLQGHLNDGFAGTGYDRIAKPAADNPAWQAAVATSQVPPMAATLSSFGGDALVDGAPYAGADWKWTGEAPAQTQAEPYLAWRARVQQAYFDLGLGPWNDTPHVGPRHQIKGRDVDDMSPSQRLPYEGQGRILEAYLANRAADKK